LLLSILGILPVLSNTEMLTGPELVSAVYKKSQEKIREFRKIINRPLTLSEKIISGHLNGTTKKDNVPEPGKSYVLLQPDRVALQDVTGQMTILQFMQAGLKQTILPTSVHCDHLIQARTEAESDTRAAIYENNEVYQFLESACRKYGIGFWKPGAGIIHQVILENYAFPGGLMIGTDSHTPNAGGLGMVAVGVGGIDAAETMAGLPWELLYPKRIGVYLTGELNNWTAPKDIILLVASELTVSGGTNAIIEYFGPGSKSISCTGKATITNMGAEIGATCSIFPYDERMDLYLRATERASIADLANDHIEMLSQDTEIEEEIGISDKISEKYFHKLIKIDLSRLEPHIAGPHTPDLTRPISRMGEDVKNNKYIDAISVALIGSCTNSSYEDMSRAAGIARQAGVKGLKVKVPLLVTPGSEMIRATIERDRQMEAMRSIGATVLANACGPCIGQWSRPELKKGQPNTIVTSYNRNFPGRNDGSRETMNFIGSPEIIVALALKGSLSFNPISEELIADDGTRFKLNPPPISSEIPENGFQRVNNVYIAPAKNPDSIEVLINKDSDRLQKLNPFPKWKIENFVSLPVLAKVKGKCTTDHISPAGAWLMYRGHLDKISDNLLLGALNAYTGEVGVGKNILNRKAESFPHIARQYREKGINWAIIGDQNYGEGSSREHAAMTPRYLGCATVIAKSFARIHETNLKKQGILALTFENPNDYNRILEDDRLDIGGLEEFKPEKKRLSCYLRHKDGSTDTVYLQHSYNRSQIEWFLEGSALNLLRSKQNQY
jgi:aconitate hydratase A / 2-methylisocitrate dehydratase